MEILALLQRLISCFKFGPEAAQQDRDFVFKGQLEPSSSICSFFRRIFSIVLIFWKGKAPLRLFYGSFEMQQPQNIQP